jgi:hypothetical protein
MKEITLEWLDYAKSDLKSCQNNIKDEFLTNIVNIAFLWAEMLKNLCAFA